MNTLYVIFVLIVFVLRAKPQCAEALFLEGRHSLRQTLEQCIGSRRSVNEAAQRA
jgi:hypothetical protein